MPDMAAWTALLPRRSQYSESTGSAVAERIIPAAAIGNAGEGTTAKVRLLTAKGNLEQRTIKLGIKSELSAEVTSGLHENDLVVIGEVTSKGVSNKSALTARKGP